MTPEEARKFWPIVGRKGRKLGHSKGYIRVKSPNHPNAGKDGYVYEHVYNASLVLGRGLKKNETAHHVYGDVADNKNLLICTQQYHRALHARMHKSEDWPQFNTKVKSNQPRCAVCSKPIGYNSTLCVEHYWGTYKETKKLCMVDGCGVTAGRRSGLCLRHLNYRHSKRRYDKDWNFSCL